LPAPVSPLKTVSPLSNEIDKYSIMAKFLIDSSDNNASFTSLSQYHICQKRESAGFFNFYIPF
jgi:hypothetical protein